MHVTLVNRQTSKESKTHLELFVLVMKSLYKKAVFENSVVVLLR